MDVIPAVDVLDGRVVRLLRGSFDAVTVYREDPVAAASEWIAQGASLVHLVDLAGARKGSPDPALWHRMARAGVPFQVGGGIREVATARSALAAGAIRVVMGTTAVHRPRLLAEVGDPDRVIAAVDVAEGEARGHGWAGQGNDLGRVIAGIREAGIGRVLVTAIARDGTLEGPDLDLINEVRSSAPEFSIIASGGVGGLDDLGELVAAGCDAVVIGRALYEDRFTLGEALAVAG
ncbi:MAG: HisA/HisF-related TIM barrel protein [Actinomycetota bacterium]